MKELLHNLAALLKVKTIISLVCLAVFAHLATTGGISPENCMVIISMVIAFYFNKDKEKSE